MPFVVIFPGDYVARSALECDMCDCSYICGVITYVFRSNVIVHSQRKQSPYNCILRLVEVLAVYVELSGFLGVY